MMRRCPRIWHALLVLGLTAAVPELPLSVSAAEPGPLQVFEQRIMPIFRSPKPSSCVQCHLAAVDLKEYILPSHEQTFVSLRDQGLIDLEQPEKSKILTLIRMGERDLDKGARLIHRDTREAELEAFSSWIKACCEDPRLCGLPRLSGEQQAGPQKPVEVIRHMRKSRVVDSFARLIWSQRMRCFPCHTPYEIDAANPRQQAAVKKHREFEKKYGELVERLKIFRETPEATLRYLIDASQDTPAGELPLINLDNPRQSLLVLKPLSKLPPKGPDGEFKDPSSSVPVTHMGGLKMHPDDQSYKAFVSWIQDYAQVVGDRYANLEELPADNWHASQLVVRVRGAPENWPVGIPVQLFVHAWNGEKKTFDSRPIAFTQGTVTPRKMVNGALFLLADHDPHAISAERPQPRLARGKYLVKAFVDFDRRLADDPTLLLGEAEFSGQAEIKKARWRPGFRHAELIQGRLLSRE